MKKVILSFAIVAIAYGGGWPAEPISENAKKCIIKSTTVDQLVECAQAELTLQGLTFDDVYFIGRYGELIKENLKGCWEEANEKAWFGQMANCIRAETAVYDKILNIKYKSVLKRFTNDKAKLAPKEPSKDDFISAQRVWVKMKEECNNLREPGVGRDEPVSLMDAIEIASCELGMTQNRLIYFEYIIDAKDVKE